MKTQIILIKTFLVLLIIPFFKVVSCEYIYFNNFDVNYNPTVYESNLIQILGTELEVVPFSDETFNKIQITDYKVAIFALGEYPLSVRTQSEKHFVIDKINQMIDAGRNVMIIAKNGLWGEFDTKSQVKHPAVNEFLTNKLGIQFLQRLPVHYVSGNTTYFQGYVARGSAKDPVGKADVKYCNQRLIQGQTTHSPLEYIYYLDVFKSRNKDKYFPVDYFTREPTSTLSDTLLGIRTQIGKSKIIFWSYGFENIAGGVFRYNLLERAMNWLTEGEPQPGAQIESLDENVYFGITYIGDSSIATVSFRNIGTEPLVVSSIEIENFSGKKVFSIIDGDKPLTLKTGEVHTVTIKFKPKEKGYFTDFLIIKSNSKTESEKAINLTGYGEMKIGGNITLSLPDNKLNFGKLPAGEKITKSFDIINTGNDFLNIDSIIIFNRDEDSVFFGDGLKSAEIPAGAKRIKEVYFNPKEEKIYNGTLKIYSDALNIQIIEIELIGEGIAASNVDEDIFGNDFSFELLSNPVNDRIKFIINDKSQIPFPLKIKLISSNGKIVYDSFFDVFSAGENIIEINPVLSSGLYYLVLEKNNKLYSKPFIILK